MSQVSVSIDGRRYRLACGEGEEAQLESLARMVDEKIGEMRKTFGEIGDQRLVIMAALSFADSLTEARGETATERKRLDEAEQGARVIASRLDELGARLEQVAQRLSGEAQA
jgi:cell division protein ZapA